jgi:predicted TIM-barrel fold metal-dependent hydrolase
MTRYDVHQHLWPEPFVRALAARSAPPCLDGSVLTILEGSFEMDLDADRPERRLALLDEHGLDVAVVSLQPTLGIEDLPGADAAELWAAYNEGILEVTRASAGRLVPLAAGTAGPGFAGVAVRAAALHDLDALAPVAGALVRDGGFLFVHPGPTEVPGKPAWWAAVVEYTAQQASAYAAWLAGGAERWPALPVVFAILAGGAPIQLERMAARGYDPAGALAANVYFDTASYGPRALEFALASGLGPRIVHGSDAPVISPAATLAAVEGLGGDAARAILDENVAPLLPRE